MAMVSQAMKLGELEMDPMNISPAELDMLRSLLPKDWMEGGVSQLDIILEAIEYIKSLQSRLQRGQ